MGFFDSVKSFLGVGESGSGGSQDAFQNFLQYSGEIGKFADTYRSRLASEGFNPYINDLGKSYGGLDRAIAQASKGASGRLRELGAALPGQLRSSALASTAGAQQAALGAARAAGGGRGGLAFGGGAGALAARAAQGAASQQSSALANALLQGQQAMMGAEAQAYGIESQGLQQRLGLAQALEQSTMARAGLVEQFRQRQDQLDMGQLQGMFGLAGSGLYGGLAGDQGRQQRKTGLFTSIFG